MFNPTQKILSDPDVENFLRQNNFAEAAKYLFNSQMNSWDLLRRNYDSLEFVRVKSFWFDGLKINVQFNPKRITSTAAKVDDESVANRKCFLCIENLPEDQKGILLQDRFILLCNPYPIFPQHFTISSLKHEPQRIDYSFKEILELTKLLSPDFNLVYNGPVCGASAPNHLHFQAGTKFFMPIENDIQQLNNDYGIILKEDDKISISAINDGLRKLIFIESNEKSKIAKAFKKILAVYKNFSAGTVEPMMNIICSYDIEFGWNVIIFLRSKHRPECFYSEGSEKVLVSPAAIDLGGILITPREEDFVKIDKDFIRKILSEVSLSVESFSLLTEKLRDAFD
jgi:ATP adenylyltransferase/5',5'''-P-1,P-4-tetraphosphate phosphorylase II